MNEKKYEYQNGMIEELANDLNNLNKNGDYIPQTELLNSIIKSLKIIDAEL